MSAAPLIYNADRVKYRSPNGQQTWSGRGRMPVWVREFITAGVVLDSLLLGAWKAPVPPAPVRVHFDIQSSAASNSQLNLF